MAMSPFALSMLGMEPASRQQGREQREREDTTLDNLIRSAIETRMESRPAPRRERAISHYSTFASISAVSHDDPPSYVIATRHPPTQQAVPMNEPLPQYSCSVEAEGRYLLAPESMNPLHAPVENAHPDWQDVYVTLRGTMMEVHRTKDGGRGRFLRNYTLQHAEVGLATDSSHTVLIPQTRLAHLIPTAARQKAFQRDSKLFRPVKQHILRIRVESDQLLLADASEDRIHELIHSISAGIDISHNLDERTLPRQCTIPRRRRRQQRPRNSGDINDPALVAEQGRILREMYPGFAQQSRQNRTEETEAVLRRTETQDERDQQMQAELAPAPTITTPAVEEDELDLAVMREDFASSDSTAPSQSTHDSSSRPQMSRQTTASSLQSTFSTAGLYATAPTNFNSQTGKWQPPHPRTPAQIQRYARRCMPILLAESTRASDILICNKRRVKIDWRMEMLMEWEISPPTYRAHNFPKPAIEAPITELTRTKSQSSQTPSATNSSNSPHSSRSELDDSDRIEPIDTGLANLELSKVQTTPEKQMTPTRTSMQSQRPKLAVKRDEVTQHNSAAEVHGVVFCF